MQPTEAVIVLACVGFLVMAIWTLILAPIGRGMQSLFGGAEEQPPPEPDREAARKLLETPMPTVDPRLWVRYKCEPEMCAVPPGPQEAEVHVPSDPVHRKACKRCQDEHRRGRVVPHAV